MSTATFIAGGNRVFAEGLDLRAATTPAATGQAADVPLSGPANTPEPVK